MANETHNTQAGEPNRAPRPGSGKNPEQSQQQTGETRPEGGARDRENRKGGDNAKNL